MKISAKGRYGLASIIYISTNYPNDAVVPIVNIADKLGISKIYLEQVFALLKNSGVVQSIKGSQGGYQLTRSAEATTAFDVLSAVEPLLFEQTQEAVSKKAPEIDKVMGDSVFALLEESVVNTLKNITLDQLALEVEKCKASDVNMFYI